MSDLDVFIKLVTAPVPAWCAGLAILALLLVQQITVVRRMRSHGRSFGHTDRWALTVEGRLDELEQRMRFTTPATPSARHADTAPANDGYERNVSFRDLSDRQVSALIDRLVRARAA